MLIIILKYIHLCRGINCITIVPNNCNAIYDTIAYSLNELFGLLNFSLYKNYFQLKYTIIHITSDGEKAVVILCKAT